MHFVKLGIVKKYENCIIFKNVGDIMRQLLIYSIIVIAMIVLGLIIFHKKITKEETKDRILKFIAIITVFLHYSSLWVDYFTKGSAEVENTMLLPIYPCNICMWLLLIFAFLKNKNKFFYKTIGEFLAIPGTICGLIGLCANQIFLSNPDFLDYDSLKGLLSHTTMIFGTLFILTQGYVKIRAISTTISTVFGLILFIIDGAIVNGIFAIFNLPSVNSMYMLEFPVDIAGLNFISLGIMGIIVMFIGLTIYEIICLDANERWYNHLKKNKVYKME